MSRRASFRRPAPTRAQQRAAVYSIAVMREKPLDDAARVSLSRSYGLTVSEVDSIFSEVARERAAR